VIALRLFVARKVCFEKVVGRLHRRERDRVGDECFGRKRHHVLTGSFTRRVRASQVDVIAFDRGLDIEQPR